MPKTRMSVITGMRKDSNQGLAKALKPAKGFRRSTSETLQTNASRAKRPKNIQRMMGAIFGEMSILNLAFFCPAIVDLNYQLETSS